MINKYFKNNTLFIIIIIKSFKKVIFFVYSLQKKNYFYIITLFFPHILSPLSIFFSLLNTALQLIKYFYFFL